MTIKRYAMPFTRIEVVLLSIIDERLCVLLGKREEAPAKGRWAMPGGVLRTDLDVSVDDAARRVASERLNTTLPYLRQQFAVGGPTRDPRSTWTLSVVYRAMVDAEVVGVTPGKRLETLRWWPVDEVAPIAKPAFDHASVISVAVEALRLEVRRLDLPLGALPASFTLTELQKWCEQVLGQRLDKSSFRRRLDERGLVETIPGALRTGANRPAQLYRATAL